MPSFNFLKQIDFFQLPVRIYFTRNSKQSKNKKHFSHFGSHLGFCLSIIIIMIGLIYLYELSLNTIDGNYDSFEDNLLHHNYKDGFGQILLTPDDFDTEEG